MGSIILLTPKTLQLVGLFGKPSLCYPNKTLDVTHVLHLLRVPLSWSPYEKVTARSPPLTPGLVIQAGAVSGYHTREAPGVPGEMPTAWT